MRTLLAICMYAVVCCGSSQLTAQITYSGNATYNPMGLQVYTLLVAKPEEYKEDALSAARREEAAELYNSRALAKYGSYYNPYDDTFRIVSGRGIQYTSLQVINNDTSETVLTIDIENADDTLDITALDKGQYTLILTDDARNIFSESVSIY